MADGPAPHSRSLQMTQKKAREQRLQRLKTMVDTRLDNPLLAIDILMAELMEEEPQLELWDAVHTASKKANLDLVDAYTKSANGMRMKKMAPAAQAQLLMRAADATPEPHSINFLERVLTIQPTHPEAFARLEKHYDKLLDPVPMLKLLGSVAKDPPKAPAVIANQVQMRVLQLKEPLPEETCHQLVPLLMHNPKVLDALEAHCRQTRRYALLCSLMEEALVQKENVRVRYKLLDLYTGDASQPVKAMDHVDRILELYPTDAMAFTTAEKLLGVSAVSSRAAAALNMARRSRFPSAMPEKP